MTCRDFNEEELKEACEGMERDEKDRIDDKGEIHFEDRLLLKQRGNEIAMLCDRDFNAIAEVRLMYPHATTNRILKKIE